MPSVGTGGSWRAQTRASAALALVLVLAAMPAAGAATAQNDCGLAADAPGTYAAAVLLAAPLVCAGRIGNDGTLRDAWDYYKFYATAGQNLHMDLAAPSGILADIYLCEPTLKNGFQICPTGVSQGGTLNFTATETGHWRLGVRDSAGAPSLFTYTFALSVGQPLLRTLSCSPSAVAPLAPVTCSVLATDDGPLYYTLDWGDGTTTRVPATGTMAPGLTAAATHAWSAAGDHAVVATATDAGTPPQTSWSRRASVRVLLDLPPTMRPLDCAARTEPGEATRCTLVADDDSPGVYFRVEWGDGALTRVPGSGFAKPGLAQSGMHAYARTGLFALRATATDSSPFRSVSAPAFANVSVEDCLTGGDAANDEANASLILAPRRCRGALSDGDADWYRFDAEANGTLSLVAESDGVEACLITPSGSTAACTRAPTCSADACETRAADARWFAAAAALNESGAWRVSVTGRAGLYAFTLSPRAAPENVSRATVVGASPVSSDGALAERAGAEASGADAAWFAMPAGDGTGVLVVELASLGDGAVLPEAEVRFRANDEATTRPFADAGCTRDAARRLVCAIPPAARHATVSLTAGVLVDVTASRFS